MISSISILGSTGSIGTQTLEVVRKHNLKVYAVAANSNIKLLEKQIREFSPKYACIFNESLYEEMKNNVSDTNTTILSGMSGLCQIASDENYDLLLNSVVGMVGLLPTLTALKNNKKIALANKETLVAGGKLVMKLSKEKNNMILPVDSEHSAIFQCLQGNERKQLKKIFLTASGGPFYGKKIDELKNIRPEDALKHPNWNMGNKVTIDSSTLMNKGLESIEAKWLFDLEPEQIEVVVHRQSVVHSAVMYDDNSVIAQMAEPDMQIPIQYAITYPDRFESNVEELSLFNYPTLTFDKPDIETFRCLKLAFDAMKAGESMPVIMNAANEIAVDRFLKKKISYLQIPELVEYAFEKVGFKVINKYEDVIEVDKAAREIVSERIEEL